MSGLAMDLVSAAFLHSVVVAAAPLIFAAMGELLIERSGVLNLAIAGMVVLSAAAAFVTKYSVGESLLGTAAGFTAGAVAGMAVALVLGLLCVTLRTAQVTAGLALFMATLGGGPLLYRLVVGITTTTPSVGAIKPVPIPGLSEIPYLGRVLFEHDLFVYASFVLIPVVAYVLFRTAIGLRLRGAGENPKCVDALGIPVVRLRYSSLALGGLLIGLAGAFFPLELLRSFNPATVTGQGWLALMLVIFGRWRPWPILLGALLFAYVVAFQFSVALSLPAVPVQVFLAAPYVLAIIVLMRISRRAESPASLGRPYDREARI